MKNTTKSYVLVSILIMFGIARYFVIDKTYNSIISENITTVLWIVLCFFTILILKYPKDKSYYRKIAVKMVISSLLFTILTSYLLGFFVGFGKNLLIYNFKTIIKTIIPILLVIVSREIIRYIIARNSEYKKLPIILFTIASILFTIVFQIRHFVNFEEFFIFICTIVLITIANELLCSYLSYNFGIVPTLIYTISLGIYSYILPIVPNLGNFLYSVIFLMLPFLIYIFTIGVVKYKLKDKDDSNNKIKMLFIILLLIFLSIIVVLVSGVFKHRMIAVASGSMFPVFDRGDAVIYEKEKDFDAYKVGEVIAFQKNGIIVTHRINSIGEIDGKKVIRTKGDANNAVDNYYVYDDELLGKIKYIVKYIGFPTVWLSETFKGV